VTDRIQLPEWDTCEDCMGTGGRPDADGEGSCGSCGGRGRRPANAAADAQVQRAERDRRLALERMFDVLMNFTDDAGRPYSRWVINVMRGTSDPTWVRESGAVA